MFYSKQHGIQTQNTLSEASKTTAYEVENEALGFLPLSKDQAVTNKDLIGIASTMFVKGHNSILYAMFSTKT